MGNTDMYLVEIEEQLHYHSQVVFGLRVAAPDETWPNVVGCSVRTRTGEIVDLPARWLSSGGRALWVLNAPDDIGAGVAVDTGNPQEGWNGQIIFALWPDEQFAQRLADTGWQSWEAGWLIGIIDQSA